ncbi:reverse transcriptase [Vairimorpha necatrix]|uniref:Reverse transcriptase n=1 Tax=Vairimorpha necatrix TaxID=6039 RepID=A0AAX4JCT3_9MICR
MAVIFKRCHIEIKSGSKMLLNKKIRRGILQRYSLSPLLFVLCMDPLSRKLTSTYLKVGIQTHESVYVTNHLLFFDDLKFLAENFVVLKLMNEETKKGFSSVGLEMNRSKSATNCSDWSEDAVALEGHQGYKYLGITEDAYSAVRRETFGNVRSESPQRVEKLCKTQLYSKNMIQAINKHAISVIN